MLAICVAVVTVRAAVDVPLELPESARAATKIVLATVTHQEAVFGESAFGDQLILTHVTLQVDETMKGAHQADVVVTLEGGTIGDLTLDVSDMPKMTDGQRAVLFLTSDPTGEYVPYGRGSGVMEVDASDNVPDIGLTVAELRASVKAALAAGGR